MIRRTKDVYLGEDLGLDVRVAAQVITGEPDEPVRFQLVINKPSGQFIVDLDYQDVFAGILDFLEAS
jgi:hypothetical protein